MQTHPRRSTFEEMGRVWDDNGGGWLATIVVLVALIVLAWLLTI